MSTIIYTIKNVHQGKAELREKESDELIINSTLDYIFEAIKQRGYSVDNLMTHLYPRLKKQ